MREDTTSIIGHSYQLLLSAETVAADYLIVCTGLGDQLAMFSDGRGIVWTAVNAQ